MMVRNMPPGWPHVRPPGSEGWEATAVTWLLALVLEYRQLAQLMTDAIHDGLIVKSPCSRRTAPSIGEQRVYVATTDQVWQVY